VGIEKDEIGVKRRIGDEWQLRGPMTYIPQPEVVCVCLCVGLLCGVCMCVCVCTVHDLNKPECMKL